MLVLGTALLGGSLGWMQGCADECRTSEDCVRGQEICIGGSCVPDKDKIPPPPGDSGPRPDATEIVDTFDAGVARDAFILPDSGFSLEPFPPVGRFEVTDIRDEVVPLYITEAQFVASGTAQANVVRRTFRNRAGYPCDLQQVRTLTGTIAPLAVSALRVHGLNGYPDPLTLSQTATPGMYNTLDNRLGGEIFRLGQPVDIEIVTDNVPGHFDNHVVRLYPPPMLFGESDGASYAPLDDYEGWAWQVSPAWSGRLVTVQAFTWPIRDVTLTCKFPESVGQERGGVVPIEAADWFRAMRVGYEASIVEVRRDSEQLVSVPLIGGGTFDVYFRLSTAQRRVPL